MEKQMPKTIADLYREFDLKDIAGATVLEIIQARQLLDHPTIREYFGALTTTLLFHVRNLVEKGGLDRAAMESQIKTLLDAYVADGSMSADQREYFDTQVQKFWELPNDHTVIG